MRKSDSRGFIGEPRRTLCTEISTDLGNVSVENWAHEGEVEKEELDMGFPFHDPHDPEYHHVDLENLENIKDDRDYDGIEDEREMNRDPEWDPNKVAKAGVNLMTELGFFSPTRQMCDVVGAYMQRLECRMDGVIHYCLDHKRDKDVVEAALEFAGKMAKYFPEISKKAKARLIADAQMEQQLQRRINGPAYRLGKAIFDSHWGILLRT